MKLPIILIVDDDPQVLRAIERDIRKEFRKSYRILSTASANEALSTIDELHLKDETIALFLSDQRMPEMLGVEFLEKAKIKYPAAKRILLTAYSDTDAAIKAINDVQLDYYLLKPWDPPTEKLYPVIQDQLDEWQKHYIPPFEGIKVVGYQYSSLSHKIKDFLAGNLVPYQWLDINRSDNARNLLASAHLDESDLPVVLFEDGSYLPNPSLSKLAEKIGLHAKAREKIYDVVIIGAGPAGLAAAVYGGSEGLKTLLVEKRAPGGQAGTSSRIENYLGFPKGLSGAELSHRAITQATRFGIEFLTPQEVQKIELEGTYKVLTLADSATVHSWAVVITTGVDYRKHPAPSVDQFTGAGVYYGAAMTESATCQDQDVYIVGGGNSAGQGAMYLSKFARKVYIVIRKPDLTSSMSSYLIDQINNTDNIEVLGETIITGAEGSDHLEKVILANQNGENERTLPAGALFIFIGARPYTDWIDALIKSEKGFIETGHSLKNYDAFHTYWKLHREPFLLETSIPGIFAAGDVRAGAMNRVASAVGEGAMAIKFVHEYLAEV